ncbi:MAG: SUMF1/EgtB/PvdO family nonheme iron enzyme [Chlamydiales bacterium]|nr:SUMF1/EgtB/PvdO family nonheme iron enzyme [Chlamydiia bacterium]MCP5507200.1 SUMF1/EgtB/PvdO family nonheme iron enzyme [Chlamydiales bacterium]
MTDTRILGDYSVIKQIGQGVLGTVYLAEHRFMKKQYVLKVLPSELATDRTFIQRFEDEVRKLAALDHPHIVKVHNISYDNGVYFLVNDCVVDEVGETTNLAQYMMARGERLSEQTLHRLLLQIADALDYAHNLNINGKGVVHRNIKLNNILVSKGEKGVNLYISDFGLSRVIGAGAVLTRTYKMVAEALNIPKVNADTYPKPPIDDQKLMPLHASFLQNYVFMAPEQKRLDQNQLVGSQADVYAFGVLAYYMLMGEFPEGYFEMPSQRHADLQYDWDSLLRECLHSNYINRAEKLTPLLEMIVRGKRTVAVSGTVAHPTAEAMASCETSKVEEPVMAYAEGGGLRPVIHSRELQRPTPDYDPAAALEVDTTVKHFEPEEKEFKNIQPIPTEMVIIQGGSFMRGSNDGNRDEQPRHEINVDSFALDQHPVTNEQYVRFLDALGGIKDCNHQDVIRLRDSRIKKSAGKFSIESGYGKHPVVGVTWYGAVAYAKWLGKRLPTEAEWEVAAHSGDEHNLYPTGETIEKTQANFFSSDTTPVMSYAPNVNGLYDMAGNVYEWCQDWYGYNYYDVSIQEPENPQGPIQGVYRVLRGGCWKSLDEDLRCSRRHRNNPGTVNGTYGFRCAADVQQVS